MPEALCAMPAMSDEFALNSDTTETFIVTSAAARTGTI